MKLEKDTKKTRKMELPNCTLETRNDNSLSLFRDAPPPPHTHSDFKPRFFFHAFFTQSAIAAAR
jgi:hypothetical protein